MPKIVLDPGHGGSDPGAVSDGVREKEVNLNVTVFTRDMLQAHGVEVLMTRLDDSYISLPDRTALANKEKVDAFVSIHHNAATNAAARGLEIYHSIVGGDGQKLARLIHDRYRALIPEFPSRGVKTRRGNDGRDYYNVIRATAMPAVLIEGGFLTNAQDVALIKTREFQENQARAISQAILEWYGHDIGTDDGTTIIGPPRATIGQAQEWALARGAHQRFIDIAPVYWEYGEKTGIRPEVVYCQAAKETAFGRYGGAVRPEQNNWAGIKTATAAGDRPEDHETFPTPEDGVRAHFNHLAAYVGVPPLGEPHGRYHIVKGISWAGSIRYVEELGGKWAPSPDYGRSIVQDYLEGLLDTTEVLEPEDERISQLEARIAELKAQIAELEAKIEAVRAIVE